MYTFPTEKISDYASEIQKAHNQLRTLAKGRQVLLEARAQAIDWKCALFVCSSPASEYSIPCEFHDMVPTKFFPAALEEGNSFDEIKLSGQCRLELFNVVIVCNKDEWLTITRLDDIQSEIMLEHIDNKVAKVTDDLNRDQFSFDRLLLNWRQSLVADVAKVEEVEEVEELEEDSS